MADLRKSTLFLQKNFKYPWEKAKDSFETDILTYPWEKLIITKKNSFHSGFQVWLPNLSATLPPVESPFLIAG